MVFDYIVNPENLPSWRRGVVEGRLVGGSLRVGSKILAVREANGGRFESLQEIAEFEPYRRFYTTEEKGEPFAVDGGFIFEPENGGSATRLHYKFVVKTGKKLGLMGPAVRGMFNREVEK